MATSSSFSTLKASSQRSIATDRAQKKKAVILLLMKNEKSQGRALTIAGKAKGIMSTNLAGTQLEVVGTGVDWMRLVRRLAKKLGDAQLRSLAVVAHDGDAHFRFTSPPVVEHHGGGGCNII